MSQLFSRLVMGISLVGSVMHAEELLDLDVISYQDVIEKKPEALSQLETALHQNGIVAIKGIPGCREIVERFIHTARAFSSLPESVKEAYAPHRDQGDLFVGYERGKEKFKRPDGSWVVDDLKTSYYALVPDRPSNRWPVEIDLKTSFQEMGSMMSEMGQSVMQAIGLFDIPASHFVEGVPQVGRMLYYRKSTESALDNPFWCGSHFDHGVFTVLIPAFYFEEGQAIPEPMEAGLFIRPTHDTIFKKVVVNDPDMLLFQIGEFGQLVMDDKVLATEHQVRKASGQVERYTMALFFDAPMDMILESQSALTSDARYGGNKGDPCSYRHWTEESLKRYLVTDVQ